MHQRRITRCMTGALIILAYLVMVLPGTSQDNSLDRIVGPQFRIVVVPAGQHAKFLEKNVREAFVSMPASEFEKLRKTANFKPDSLSIPALTQASYQAEWKDNGIIGKANWVFNSSSKKQNYFPISPLNIAIKKASWEGKEALLGDFITGTTSLLIPENNASPCNLEWSLKAEQLPDGYHLSLRIPQASLQSFELTIPFNWNFILASKGSIETLSPVTNSGKKVLKISASGETKIDLLLQDPAMHGRFDSLRVEKLQASHEVAPEATYSDFVFSFDGITNGLKTLEFEYSETMKILEVLSDQVESWKIVAKEGASILEITLRNNLCRPDKIMIRSLTPSVVKKSLLWKTPWLRFIPLPSYREEITIVAGAGIRLEDLILGDFLLADTRSKQSQNSTLRLIGGGITAQKTKTYPSIKVSVGGAQFRTQQEVLFQPTLSGASLQTNISYFLLNGSISSLLVQLPIGWEVEQLSLNADTHIKDWSVLINQGKQLLRIELENPLIPSNTASLDQNKSRPPALTIRLSPETKSKKTILWGFPTILPLNSMLNEGFFAIQYDASSFQAILKSDLVETDVQNESQSFKQPCNHLFKFSGNPPAGSIELNPLTGVSTLRFTSAMVFEADRTDTKLDILLSSENGLVEKFDLLLPKSMNPDSWKWLSNNRNSTFKKIEKISVYDYAKIMAGLTPLPGISLYNLSAIIPSLDRWRFHLYQPLSTKESINFNAAFNSPLPLESNEIPLIGFPPEQRFDATIQIQSLKNNFLDFRYKGLKSLPSSKPKLKTFIYDSSSPSLYLNSSAQADITPYGSIEQAILEKSFHVNGKIENQLKLNIKEWDNDFLNITLPANSDVKEIRINNKILSNFIFKEDQIHIPYIAPSITNPTPSQIIITYHEDAPNGWLWKTMVCSFPALPVVPIDKSIYWIIPSDMEPIASANTHRNTTNYHGNDRSDSVLSHLFPFNYLLKPMPLNYGNSEDSYNFLKTIVQQKPVLNASGSTKLNEFIKSLQLYLIKNNYSLVLDLGSVEITNLNPNSNLPDVSKTILENLELLGLKLVPLSNGVLLTNRNAELLIIDDKAHAASISFIMQEAVAQGMDKSKRFVAAWQWLLDFPNLAQSYTTLSKNNPKKTPLQLFAENESLILVNSQHIQSVGLLLAFILLAFISLKNIPFMFYIELTLLLLASLSLSWLPPPLLPLVWWFLLAWITKKIIQYATFIVTAPKLLSPQAAISVPVKTASLLLVLVFFYNNINAQSPKLLDVYLLAEPDSSLNEPTYLVPDALIKQFRDFKFPINEAKSFITKAQYDGVVLDNSIIFNAIWNVHCTGPSNLEIPVSGGWLTDKVFLNDLPAFPVTKANGMVAISIPKSGNYTLKVEFKVGVSEKLAERTSTFRLPVSPINFFQCEFPNNAEQPTLSGSFGATMVARSGNVTKLNSDLGKVSGPLNLRWSKGPLAPKSNPLIQEAYLWDIAVDASRLQAFWDLQIPDAGTDFFEIDLPSNLIPATINPSIRQGLTPVTLNNWHLKPIPMGQRLTLNFSRRISGSIQVQAFFNPINGLTSRWQLPVPTPIGIYKEGGSYLAYKSTNCNITRQILPLRLTGINSKNFAPFWPETEKPETETLAFAYSFRREPNNPPVLTLDISPDHFKFDVTQTIKGHIQTTSSQFLINATLKSTMPDILFVEMQIDGLAKHTVTKLVGEGVQSWSQNGSKVVIWLDKPSKDLSFTVEIFAPNISTNTPAIVEIPRINFLFATKITSNITLSHDNNTLLKPINLKGFGNSPNPLNLVSNEKNYQAQYEIKQLLPSGSANILLWFEQKENQTKATLDIEINRIKDGASNYELSIMGWGDEDLKFDLPMNVKLEPLSAGENIRKWSVMIPESQKKGIINFRVSHDISKSLATGIAKIPMWNLMGVEAVSSWIKTPNEILSMANIQGLLRVANLGTIPESPMLKKSAGDKNSDYFKVNAKSWAGNLRQNNQKFNREESPIVIHNILQGEVQKSGSIKGTSVFWFTMPAGSFKVLLAKPSEFVACHLDDVLIYPENIDAGKTYVFKTSKSGYQRLSISFQLLPAELKWSDFLNISPVLITKSSFGKTIIVGTQPFQSWKFEPAALYDQELTALKNQAMSLLENSKNLARDITAKNADLSSLQPLQELFFQIIARARILNSLTNTGEESTGWEEDFLQKNRETGMELNFEAIIAKAERNVARKLLNEGSNRIDSLFNPRIVSLLAGEKTPDLTMISKRSYSFQNNSLLTVLWFGFIISVYYLSSMHKFHKILAITWPEQLLLAGIGSYLFFGLSIMVLFFIISGVAGRIFALLFNRKVFIQSLQFK